jgi:hypothetical protein
MCRDERWQTIHDRLADTFVVRDGAAAHLQTGGSIRF